MLISKPVIYDKMQLAILARIGGGKGQKKKKNTDPPDIHRGETVSYSVCGILLLKFN